MSPRRPAASAQTSPDAEAPPVTGTPPDASPPPDAPAASVSVAEAAPGSPSSAASEPAEAVQAGPAKTPAPLGFGPRRGTARTRAAQADLAARASTIAWPEISATAPAWRQASDQPPGAEQDLAAPPAGLPAGEVPGDAMPASDVPAGALPTGAAAPQGDLPPDSAPQGASTDRGILGGAVLDAAVRAGETSDGDVPAGAVPPGADTERDAGANAAPEDDAREDPAAPEAALAVIEPPDTAASPAAGSPVTGSTAIGSTAIGSTATGTGPAVPAAALSVRARPVSLSARLMALARMIQIGSARSGRDGFGSRLLADAEDVLAKAGERMRLSSAHTVVVLAGGTGSGKSSLFNRLAGAQFSTVGVTRPVTRQAHACVWGSEQGAGAILEWLKVPARHRYARSSALDSGEDNLAGLVLLDLPDHDSVMSHAGEEVGRLVGMADVMVWVLDPQKYADAAVHRRFLVPMAGHSAVVAVVLNQADLLEPAQVDDCVADLRRLLDSENLPDVPIVVTSAATGTGLDELRALLGRGVAARRAATVRISADLDGVVTRFLPFAGDVETEPDADEISAQMLADRAAGQATTWSSSIAAFSAAADVAADVSAGARRRLAERLAAAAGVAAIGETLRSARELRAVDFVGWPVAWFVQRVTGRDPARKARVGELRGDLRTVTAGPAGAQQAEIDNALTELGAELARPLPKPWSTTIKNAVRARAEQLPAAIGTAIGEALPPDDEVAWWWRLAGLWQGLLLGAAAVAIAWSLLIAMVRILHAESSMPGLMSDPGAVPWLIAAAIVALALGAGTTALCMKAVRSTVEREKVQVTADMQAHIAAVAQEMVIAEAEQELSEFLRYREEARIASGGMEPAPAG